MNLEHHLRFFQLLSYFADCVKTLQKQLVAGYQSAIGDATNVPDTSSADIQSVKDNIASMQQSVSTLVSTATAAASSLTMSHSSGTIVASAMVLSPIMSYH